MSVWYIFSTTKTTKKKKKKVMSGITLIFCHLNANFDKSTIRLYFLQISFMFAKKSFSVIIATCRHLILYHLQPELPFSNNYLI